MTFSEAIKVISQEIFPEPIEVSDGGDTVIVDWGDGEKDSSPTWDFLISLGEMMRDSMDDTFDPPKAKKENCNCEHCNDLGYSVDRGRQTQQLTVYRCANCDKYETIEQAVDAAFNTLSNEGTKAEPPHLVAPTFHSDHDLG